eukprot:TRINITY_DN4331_c0_g1_i8.p1 TRINITY_DN4331_c0_g1~~TRINITY_DN4331_c0_g1_i8.p1  ORF type:complete len:430 (-),score=51.93 TRINITY_DN4331_c0_g1_i8:307-1596(-)
MDSRSLAICLCFLLQSFLASATTCADDTSRRRLGWSCAENADGSRMAGSNTLCEEGVIQGGRRRTWAGEAYDTCKLTCGVCSADPTAAPTYAPTVAPTVAPSNNPTDAPTYAPTTGAPNSNPTDAPTVAPTYAPTVAPTVAPSNNPTDAPTNAPTSFAPSQHPTPTEAVTSTVTHSATVTTTDTNELCSEAGKTAYAKAVATTAGVASNTVSVVSCTTVRRASAVMVTEITANTPADAQAAADTLVSTSGQSALVSNFNTESSAASLTVTASAVSTTSSSISTASSITSVGTTASGCSFGCSGCESGTSNANCQLYSGSCSWVAPKNNDCWCDGYCIAASNNWDDDSCCPLDGGRLTAVLLGPLLLLVAIVTLVMWHSRVGCFKPGQSADHKPQTAVGVTEVQPLPGGTEIMKDDMGGSPSQVPEQGQI